jgi:YegS/Rv2252/BmrU family lipid kinase
VTRNPETFIIVNPKAGGGRGYQRFLQIQKKLNERGCGAEWMVTEGKGHAEMLARQAAEQGYGRVFACGGDGTLHEVINGLAETPIPVGILPCGRGNDAARFLGISKDLNDVCEVVQKGEVRKIDLLTVNGQRYVCGVCSLGFDSQVASWANRYGDFLGPSAYTLGILATLCTFTVKSIRIEHDHGSFSGKVLLVASGNGGCYGGGIRILPEARIDDGVMDVCIIRKTSRFKVLFLAPQAFVGRHVRRPEVMVLRTRGLTIDSETPLELLGDGEWICRTPASIEIRPSVLNVIVPPHKT